jgi:hypothetical protein
MASSGLCRVCCNLLQYLDRAVVSNKFLGSFVEDKSISSQATAFKTHQEVYVILI